MANSALTVTGTFNKRLVFKWNNTTAAFDQLTTTFTPTVVGKPTDYYILLRRLYDRTEVWDPTLVAEIQMQICRDMYLLVHLIYILRTQ